MPRRRMMDPFFWIDRKVGRLSRDERSLVAGCMGHTDDKGRIEANPAYLKAIIFKYDDDLDNTAVKELRDSCLTKMNSWPVNHPYRMVLYANADEEYIFFPNFSATNKPSHPTESQLPSPPPEALPIFSREKPEGLPTPTGDIPSQVRSGQSSLDKDRLGQEDFAKYLYSEKDLTDFLTWTLEEYLPRGPAWVMSRLKPLWRQATGAEMDEGVYQTIWERLAKHPIPILAISLAKAIKYSPGKKNPAHYIKTIFDQQQKEFERIRAP